MNSFSPRRYRYLRWLALCLVLAGSLLSSVHSQEKSPVTDVPPVQRVMLPAARLAAELERAKRGVLVALPRSDFEDRLKKAALVGDSLKSPPRLVAARYVAKLVDTALEGRAEWKVVNPTALPGILSLQPFNLALRRAWCDNRDAVLGELDGKELGLLIERPADDKQRPAEVLLDWSARSLPAAGGLRFSLETPPCAIATLELDLPADRAVVASRDAYLLSGPFDAGASDRKSWRLSFAGKRQLDFEVRRSEGTGLPPPLVLSKQQTRQELTPGQFQGDYDFDLEVLHGSVKMLRLECAPLLRPYEVNVRSMESWELRTPPPEKPGPATLLIRLREPFQSGSLQVRCLAPLVSHTNWTSPAIRLLDAVPSGETITLRIHPGVRIEDWQPAAFRLTRSLFQADGWHVLTLLAGVDAGPNPPGPARACRRRAPNIRSGNYCGGRSMPTNRR